MQKIKFFLLAATTIIIAFGCKKQNGQNPDRADLLAKQPWKLLSYGYDYNNDGWIDSSEENISSCQKDNTYIFNPNGSGIVMENAMICDGDKASSQFNWALTNNETRLDFIYGIVFIDKISKDSLIISDTDSDPIAKLLFIYRH